MNNIEHPLVSEDKLQLSVELHEELVQAIRGDVLRRSDASFADRTRLFNGQIATQSKAVVLPLDAEDVSSVIKFCVKHGLSPSVKAGGYGTAGWAVAGDIVLDLSKLDYIDIQPPSPDGVVSSLRDVNNDSPVIPALSPQQQQPPPPPPFSGTASAKRRRSPDAEDLPRSNLLVADFLRGADMGAPPSLRRKVGSDGDGYPVDDSAMSRQSSSSSADSDHTAHGSVSTLRSSPPTSPDGEGASADAKGKGKSAEVPMDTDGAPSGALDTVRDALAGAAGGVHQQGPATADAVGAGPFAYADHTPTTDTAAPSSDPFAYLSAGPTTAPSVSSSSRTRPYVYAQQSAFQPPTSVLNLVGAAGAGAGAGAQFGNFGSFGGGAGASGSRLFSQDSPQLGSSTTPPTFMPSVTTPLYSHAYVSFGAGVKQKALDVYTGAHPLPARDIGERACTVAYHVPLAAHPVGSSVMLLGGFGFLARLHGLSIDALVEAEVVLADGRTVFVNEREHPDLWWALRGAGPAFGVVTRYKAKAYPVPVVFAGNLIYKFRAATAPSLVKHFRDCVKGAPRELYANVLFTAGPADKDSVVVVQICYVGARDKGQAFLQTMSSWDGERCLLNEVDEKTFCHQQDSVAQILRGKSGRQWYIRSALITSLPDDVIHATVTKFAGAPVGCTWLFELAGGAVADFKDSCLPVKQREASFTIAAFHQWELGVDDPRCIATAEEWIEETLAPVSTGGPYPSFLGRKEKPARAIACFGENWERLCEIKRKYDPAGLFRNTFWPVDIHGEPIAASTHEPPSP